MPQPFFADAIPSPAALSPLRQAITAACRRPEADCLAPLFEAATLDRSEVITIRSTAAQLVQTLRNTRRGTGVEGLVQEYSLSSAEGTALMCLAEALLRVPDTATRDALIRDKLAGGDWSAHLGGGRSLFVNAATWGLVVTGKLVGTVDDNSLAAALTRLVARAGEPVIRKAVDMAMRLMGEQFVLGQTIEEALDRAQDMEARGYAYSYDMLGEAAATAADSRRYCDAYERAIHAIGARADGRGIHAGPGISIKLSALHPRYARAQAGRVMGELLPRVRQLADLCRRYGIGFNIDAEEADRLDLSLDIFEALALDPALTGWDGLGFVVQAYGKRCPFVIDWLVDLARRARRRIMVRLVKGAYWDAEIKRAQVDGLADFPVYTRKAHTDVAYIACARKLLDARDAVFPQFATHNAQTVATIHHLAGPDFTVGDYEFQCLHGMGEGLYDQVVGEDGLERPCRIYAPVGTHETLLAYLVRRLLENGANSSFVHRIGDAAVPIDELVADPVVSARELSPDVPGAPNPLIAHPSALFSDRRNSAGLDLADEATLAALGPVLQGSASTDWRARPMVVGLEADRRARAVLNPADRRDRVGTVAFALERDARLAATAAARAAAHWAATDAHERAACLERAADTLQARMPLLIGLIVREAGKSLPNAVAELREAMDFLRYYAVEGPKLGQAAPLGPVVCISPWNFPLAIFTGQIAAALVAGNPVLAKPAEETPLIAAEAVRILHASGIPADVLQFLPGDGATGAALVAAPETAGVMFTGSTEVARLIQRQLATRLGTSGQPIPLVAETGGQNAMIVDSTALPEQVVADVLASAFDSAGQRCSALRVLCLQEDVADRVLTMLKGAMAQLRVGRPDRLATDVGPVITAEARAGIEAHIAAMRQRGCAVQQIDLPAEAANGTFVAPTLIEIASIDQLEREVFGPVLHVVRFSRDELDGLVDAINATGYGLTFGLHTRLDTTVERVTARIGAGNVYINRNVIGAVVGVQPFGGHGLSGTGLKAGGPLYLRRLVDAAPVPEAAHQLPASLEVFAAWLDARGEGEAAQRARRTAARAPALDPVELPGPVGERNVYQAAPRGQVLLRATTEHGLWDQIAAVLATRNGARIEGRDWPADLPPAVREALDWPASPPLGCVLVEGDAPGLLAALGEFAAANGRIVPVLSPGPAGYPLEMLVTERVVSTNTTAAGGNASLMMLD